MDLWIKNLTENRSNRRRARVASRLARLAGKNDARIDRLLAAIRNSVEKGNIDDFRKLHRQLSALLVEEARDLVKAVIEEILVIYGEITEIRQDRTLITKFAKENKIPQRDAQEAIRQDDETLKQLRDQLVTLRRYVIQEWRMT